MSRLHGRWRRICVAVDDDDALAAQLMYAAKLIVKEKDVVGLLHVVPPSDWRRPPGGDDDAATERAVALLRRAEETLLRTGRVRADQIVLEVAQPGAGRGVGQTIAQHCGRGRCQVLVVGSRRRGDGPATQLGSGSPRGGLSR